MMRAITLVGGNYKLDNIRLPEPGNGEVLIKVTYAGINRADLFQKQGRYPLPEKSPAIPGMEVSGEIIACASDVIGFTKGDKVCAIMAEGAFAECVTVKASHVLPVPAKLTLEEAAALPEACFTAWISFVWQAHIQPGETVLVHGGASGIGNMAIQIARQLGARVFASAGSAEKCDACTKAGAYAINYKTEDFVEVIKQQTQGRGVDIILDMVGGDYLPRNLAALAHGGRLCIIAFLKGPKFETSLTPVLLKHLSIMGSTLRSRPDDEKTTIAADLRQQIWPALGTSKGIKPMIAKIFSLNDAEKALQYMDQGLNIGKILLRI